MYIADLHIHSKYSRATSRDCDAPHLDLWARTKGIGLIGTGDFTHPRWREELREALLPEEEGLYALKEEFRLPAMAEGAPAPRFVVTGEISSIYKKNGKTRKVHNLIVLPSLEAADRLAMRLERIGNIHSDGRPILGLDSRDLLEITLDACPEAIFIPAHIWTPHFALFGAFSGFDAIEECFEDLTPSIHALETGLSSDPPMNWRVSALDRFTLVSNSDAHSPSKLGREANLIGGALSYPGLFGAISTGEGFEGTIEFFPENGKYHLDGHRGCGVRLEPEETVRLHDRCPVCGKKLTIGVLHRVCELADRPEGTAFAGAKPFECLAPLPELIAASIGATEAAKAVGETYRQLLRELGSEFFILREARPEDVERAAGPLVAEGLKRLRAGRVERIAGFDGEYGRIVLLSAEEREFILGQTSFFGVPQPRRERIKRADFAPHQRPSGRAGEQALAPQEDALNAEQLEAVLSDEPALAVIAGPGTGKTKTLVARIAHLIEARGVKPSEITAVTFTNQAADEMRARLEARLGGKRAVKGMTIGTFHAICWSLLDKKPLVAKDEALSVMRAVLAERGESNGAAEALKGVSRVKNGLSPVEAGLASGVFDAYAARLSELGARDFDDLILDALNLDGPQPRMFKNLLVDEFQDINAMQRRLVMRWSQGGDTLFVIGDPDQSIYGFRGASAGCFEELGAALEGLHTVALRKNYRSTPEIIHAALGVIQNNPSGGSALEPVMAHAAPVRAVLAETPFSEGIFIAKEVGRLAGGMDMASAGAAGADGREARPFSDMAVLARTHRQLDLIEQCLRHDGIACVVSGRGDELDDAAVRAALAFFRFALDPSAAAALGACLALTYGLAGEDAARAERAFAQLKDAKPAGEALRAACVPQRLVADFDGFASLVAREKPAKLIERWEMEHPKCGAMARLKGIAAFHADMAALLHALEFGEEADLRRASGRSYASGAVRLMTLHGAKGLEFPVVFLAGVTAGALPLERAGRIDSIEEERRLLYVGMTRAKEELILTTGGPPSAFLSELPEGVQRQSAPEDRRRHESEQLKLF